METEQAKRIKAFKKLFKIALDGSAHLYATVDEDCYHSARSWDVEWEGRLGGPNYKFKNEAEKQKALNDALDRLVHADWPTSPKQMQKEKDLVRLMLDAGADPNASCCGIRIFDELIDAGKSHMALEVAKTKGFKGPENVQKAFDFCANGLEYYMRFGICFPGDSKNETLVNAQTCADKRELAGILLQMGFLPRSKQVLDQLSSIVAKPNVNFLGPPNNKFLNQIERMVNHDSR